MLINKTKNALISKKVKYCRSFLSKATGFMFSKSSNKTLIFIFDKEKKCSIHMFFVFFAIDVLFLNKKRTVVEMKENLKPFTIYIPKKKLKYIIELPAKTIKNKQIKNGDIMIF
jgi:hypothetical protein